MRGICVPGNPAWCTTQDKQKNFFFSSLLIVFLHSCSLICIGCIALKQQCKPYTNTNFPAMIPTYGRVLSTIEKALQELVEKYQGIRRSLQDLVEEYQLTRIGAVMEQRQSLKKNSQGSNKESREEDKNDKEGFKEESRESQEKVEEEILFSASCQFSFVN